MKLLRKIIGQLANLTPGVIYYPKGWPARINGVLNNLASTKDGKPTTITTASVSLACAIHEWMSVGDQADIELAGVTYGTTDVGSFTVTIRRTA